MLPAKQRVQILLDFMRRSIAAELSLEIVRQNWKEHLSGGTDRGLGGKTL